MPRTHIFHIADIHIHSHNYAHIAFAWKQLVAAIVAFPNYKTDAVLAIAGDIFDHKMWLQADDITLFNTMMNDLERFEIRTIMMPGNHDYNINQNNQGTTSSDKILALISGANYKFITHCSLSCVFILDNLAFFIHSPIDLGTPRPDASHRDFKTIAMVHEPLTNSKTGSGITFQGQRFSAANFAPLFDLTLLGDIHLPQKLAQNVAYSGSFVQKNRGEGIEHGYFLWDIAQNNGQFVEIPQLSVHIKVNAAGDAEPTLPVGSSEKPIVARSVQLHYTGCSEEWVRKYSSTLQDTYKRPIDGAYNKNKIGATEIKAADAAPTIGELDTIIMSSLTNSSGVSPSQKDRVIAIHRKKFESRTTKDAPPGDWRIRFLSWSNLYCYGDSNWLDFDALDNLNSIIGPNKTGKSSIIDILILALFNETVRGVKKFALNTSARQGYIKCIISIGTDAYAIERAWIDVNNVVVRLYKNDVNISGTDMPTTYAIIEGLIGSKRIFINTAIALQHRQFLVDISSKERYELVCRMIDLDRLRAVEDENKIELRVAKKTRKDMNDAPDVGMMQKQLIELCDQLEAHKTAAATCTTRIDTIRQRKHIVTPDSLLVVPLSCAEISRRVDAIEQLGDFHDQELLTTSKRALERLTLDIEKADRESEFIRAKITSARASLKPEPKDTTFGIIDARIAAASGLDMPSLMSAFTKANEDSARITADLLGMNKEVKYATSIISAFSMSSPARSSKDIETEMNEVASQEFVVDRILLDEIPKLKARIDVNTTSLLAKQTKLAELARDPRANAACVETDQKDVVIVDIEASVEAEIKAHETSIAGFVQSADSIARFGKLMSESASASAELFHWAQDCGDCAHNRNILGNSANSSSGISTELARIETARINAAVRLSILLTNTREYYAKVTKQLALVIKSDYNTLTSIVKRRDAAEANGRRQNQLNTELLQARDYERSSAEIEQHRVHLMELRSLIIQREAELLGINATIAATQQQLQLYQSIDTLRATHALFAANRAIQAEIAQFEVGLRTLGKSRGEMMLEQARLRAIVDRAEFHLAKLTELTELTNMFGTAQLAEDARDELSTLDAELEQKEVIHKSLLEKIAQTTHTLGMLTANIGNAEAKVAAIAAADIVASDLELYDKVINHKTGIPMEMMRSVCARIQNKCNEVFEQIADFRIGVVFDDEVHLNVISSVGGAHSIVSAEQSSGYQKFIIDIIMRQVLCTLTASGCPRILFVDEGFGSADEENFGVICRKVLPLLARSFEKVIVVSHIAGIHEYTTKNCVIAMKDDKSKLEFGARDDVRMKLRVLDDHAESQKAVVEEKTARKAEDKVKKAAEREQKKQDDKKSTVERLDTIGDSIFVRVDPKTLKCDACDKVFKETLGFAARHIASAAHVKALKVWLKNTSAEAADA
jgi:hypothetical protein